MGGEKSSQDFDVWGVENVGFYWREWRKWRECFSCLYCMVLKNFETTRFHIFLKIEGYRICFCQKEEEKKTPLSRPGF